MSSNKHVLRKKSMTLEVAILGAHSIHISVSFCALAHSLPYRCDAGASDFLIRVDAVLFMYNRVFF